MMKNSRSKIRFWWSIPFVCIPHIAHADAMIPYMVVPWGQVFLLPIVILIEAAILQRLLGGKFRTIIFQSSLANFASTVLGAALYLATMPLVGDRLFEWWFKGDFSSEAVRSACISVVFVIFLWTISWLSEAFVIARMRKVGSIRQILFPSAIANLASYAILLTLALWFSKPHTPIDLKIDLKRNSANIEASLKPDKKFPYIGFWKTNCTDNYGLAIESTTDGKYTVAFCGPGGCDKTD